MYIRTTMIVAVLFLAVFSLVITGATAQPTSADEYLNELNNKRDSEALNQYTELDLARSQAVVELQTQEEFDERTRRQMHHLLNAIIAFEQAYEVAQEDPKASLEHADEASMHLEELAAAGGTQYSGFGTVALERFYANQGEKLYEEAQQEEATPDRIVLLRAATHAFDRAGEADRYTDTQIEHDELSTQYERDRERHDELVTNANSYLNNCEAACQGVTEYLQSSPFGVVDEYTSALDAYESATEASEIAAEHGLNENSNSAAADLKSETFSAIVTTAIASAILAFLYAGLFIILAAVLIWRLSVWAEDIRKVDLEQIVSPLEVDNG